MESVPLFCLSMYSRGQTQVTGLEWEDLYHRTTLLSPQELLSEPRPTFSKTTAKETRINRSVLTVQSDFLLPCLC